MQQSLFSKMSFKLSASYAVIILSLAIVGCTGFHAAQSISGDLGSIFNRFLPAIDYLIEADRDMQQLLVAERSMLLVENNSEHFARQMKEYETNLKQASDRFAKYKPLGRWWNGSSKWPRRCKPVRRTWPPAARR